MKNFAVLDSNDVVINLIVAETKNIAESVTSKTCIEFDPTAKLVDVGFTLSNGKLVAPKPYPSWTLDSNGDWQPPTPAPTGTDLGEIPPQWNESKKKWE